MDRSPGWSLGQGRVLTVHTVEAVVDIIAVAPLFGWRLRAVDIRSDGQRFDVEVERVGEGSACPW